MQRFVSSVTTSISSSRLSISVSMPVQSVMVTCINRQSSRMLSLLSMIALMAVTNRALMVSSSRCGVSHLCSPLNLLLHCQMTQRYFEVEFQTFEPKYEPQSPQIIWEKKCSFRCTDGLSSYAAQAPSELCRTLPA